jgi:hypothetical protein
MTRFKGFISTVGFFIVVYIVAWVFGNHGHKYLMEPAEEVGTEWTCPPSDDEQGPFWDNGKENSPVCHVPERQCPWLWFPVTTVTPCPYKDPLGGPWSRNDLLVLEQIKASQHK